MGSLFRQLFFSLILISSARSASVQLEWIGSQEASFYRVRAGVASDVYTLTVSSPSTSVIVAGLNPNTVYYFSVFSVSPQGIESLPSNEVSWNTANTIIRGKIVICGTGQPSAGVMVTISGGSNGFVFTNNLGEYQFTVPISASYTITPSKAPVTPGSSIISTLDVVALQRYYLNPGKYPTTCNAATDVDGSGGANTVDAIAVQRFIFGHQLFNVGQYRFYPVIPTLDFTQVLLGDCQ
jgi:hypothetical protein